MFNLLGKLKEGQPYNDLKKTITINILDFNYIGTEKYNTVFHLWEDSNKNCKLTDVLEIRFLEIPKFRKAQPDMSKPLDRWMVFIEDSPEEALETAKREEPAIARAEEVLKQLGSYDEIRRYYEAREMAIHDEISRITGAREEGRDEGIEEGERKKAMQIAESLLGILDDRTISEKTGLSLEDVGKLRIQ
ncbi:MAG: Rpn family recombination-promoting nuclease/putative transposase [Clostridiales bacterium]|nr:Rpn family recombination-promoting nuclease/putative transposase [Clostridiales bacterium]